MLAADAHCYRLLLPFASAASAAAAAAAAAAVAAESQLSTKDISLSS